MKRKFPGRVGFNFEVNDAHSIEVSSHANGSGPDSFGGAKRWPVVTLQVSFQTSEEVKARVLASKLETFLIQEGIL